MSNGFNAVRKKKIKRDLFAKFGGMCVYCKYIFSCEALTLDHVYQRSRGGGNNRENLVLACEPCNQLREATTERARFMWKLRHMKYIIVHAIGKVE